MTPVRQLSAFEIRRELIRLTLNELLAPAGGTEEEVVEDSIRDRYLIGLLAPRKQTVEPEDIDDLGRREGMARTGAPSLEAAAFVDV